ncbi:hypothetical protein D3C76_1385670 [compost metagenome]
MIRLGVIDYDVRNIQRINQLCHPVRIFTAKLHIHGIDNRRLAGFQQIGIVRCAFCQNQPVERHLAVIDFSYPIRILGNLYISNVHLSSPSNLILFLYQHPHSITGTGVKRRILIKF